MNEILFRTFAGALARVGLVGTALVVVAAIGTAVVGGSVVSNANSRSFEIAADRDAANLAAASSVFTVSVSDTHVTTVGGSPVVSRIRMRVAIASSQDVRMAVGGTSAWPRFTFRQEGNHPLLDAPTPAGPATLATGSKTTYDLTFEAPQLSDGGKSRIILASTYVEPTLGNWVLRMQLEDNTGRSYEVTTSVVVASTP
jgi:RNase P/RNase MRP subunit p29